MYAGVILCVHHELRRRNPENFGQGNGGLQCSPRRFQ